MILNNRKNIISFSIGLFSKILIILLFSSSLIENNYLAFMNIGIQGENFSPWKDWLLSGGKISAFPFGYVMYLINLPIFLLSNWALENIYVLYGLQIILFDLWIVV